ncbi:YHYH domain-containing protein (plasmid) [Alteromonas sp. RKMC-009]|nr:YHYH domain-containing protein [Alteromonas sp. RKMC-009]
MNKILYILIILAAVTSSFSTIAHSGRTNANGCHNDKKNNSYHCHGQKSEQNYQPTKPASSAVLPAISQTDDVIVKLIIADSIKGYSGNCPCPYNTTSNGSRCGNRSAYSKPGGYEPICYSTDVTPDMIKTYRSRKN